MGKRTSTGKEHAKFNKGHVQLFFERHRGKAFIQALVNRFKYPSVIVIYLVRKYDFKCTRQSILNYMKAHNIARQGIGGDNHHKHPHRQQGQADNGEVETTGKAPREQVYTVIPGEMYNHKEWYAKVAEARGKAGLPRRED